MITKLAGGTRLRSAQRHRRQAMDLWIEDGRIVRAARRRQGRRGDRRRRQGGDAGRHRPAQPYRRRQGQHRADDAARGASRARPAAATAAAAAAAAMPARRPSPPATPMPAWATPWPSSRRCCRPTRARRTRRWPTCRCSTKAPTSLLGNDDLFLGLVKDGAGPGRDPRLRRLDAARDPGAGGQDRQPGGISAFKFNGRKLDLDEAGPFYGITPRTILTTLADALTELGVPHPIHVHGCNLGVPGGDATTLATIAGMEGRPIHLTHLQFHSYGKDGQAEVLQRGRRHRRAGQREPQRLGRRRPGDVRPDRDRVRRHDEPGAQRALRLAQEVGGHGHRVRGRLRRAAVPLPRPEPGQRAAMVRRARAVPADRRPVARVPDHRPPQRRAVHHLPASDPAADGQELPRTTCWPRSTRVPAPPRRWTGSRASTACTRSRSSPGPARRGSWASRTAHGHLGPGAMADVTVYEDHADRERMFAAAARCC